MARSTTTKTAARTPRTKVVAEAPKRRPGRPLGSTNARSAAAKAKKPVSKRQAAPKIVARAPKMSKGELEAHVAKLERSIGRLREKNKELKQIAVEAQDRADMIESQRQAAPPAAARPARKAARRKSSAPADTVSETPDEEPAEPAEA